MDGPWRWGSRFAGNILPPAPIRSDPIHYRITAACRVMHKQKQIVCGWLRYKIPKTSDKIDIIGRKLHFHKNFLRPFEKEARGKEGFKLFRPSPSDKISYPLKIIFNYPSTFYCISLVALEFKWSIYTSQTTFKQ